jgi:hypothetical protein
MDEEDQKLFIAMQQAALTKATEKWGDRVEEMLKMEPPHRFRQLSRQRTLFRWKRPGYRRRGRSVG